MANIIKFDCNYPKLCNQTKARLVYADEIRECVFNFPTAPLKALLEYDTKRPDGTYRKITPQDYVLLFFVGDKGIMFSTLRKDNSSNEKKYGGKVGQWFNIEVKSE